MEMYMWFNSCEEDDCIRMLFREYLRFRVKGKEVAFINMYGNNKNDNAFLGGGRFSRKKMEEALPGEKISKPSIFRW
jgi:hypothetical protein